MNSLNDKTYIVVDSNNIYPPFKFKCLFLNTILLQPKYKMKKEGSKQEKFYLLNG